MKSPYVNELQPNQAVTAAFLVQTKEVRQKKSGEPYLCLTLSDRTGELDAKMWDNVAEVVDTFDRDDFLRVKGQLQVYQNRLQLTVHKLSRLSMPEVDLTDFLPASQRRPEEMFGELQQIVSAMTNPHLKSLLEAVLSDEEIARRFRLAPAAKSIHHAYLGGLLEHVLSLCQLAKLTAAHYSHVDYDLLLAGVVLHDLGKVYELTYERTFGYSADGQLLGHIIIALRILSDKLTRFPEFPEKLRTLLEHMIISHHGELEFGSPKVPLFLEALLLHHLDNLDSKMEAMRAYVERDRAVTGCFTAYCSSLERAILKKHIYVEGVPVPQVTALPAEVQSPAAPTVQDGKAKAVQTSFAEKLQFALRKDA